MVLVEPEGMPPSVIIHWPPQATPSMSFVVATREALRQGADGWVDEGLAIAGDWRDIDLAVVSTAGTWWHAAGDANAPLSAARRLVERLPCATLRLFGEHEGHLASYHREGEILDELLARG